mmetsp:Transcript_18421/g.40122  ORF Transcript_18421/g.40122 Transcript_18421/m.40122 type:complete len:366 (-) Transcript_18421:173-1270(-)
MEDGKAEAVRDDDSADGAPVAAAAATSAAAAPSSSAQKTAKAEFPFFRERREPWFWFNNICFLVALAFFLYFLTTIVRDFIKQKNDPPTATNLNNGMSQNFPGMAFCTHQADQMEQPDLEPLFAVYDNGVEVVDVSSQLRKLECPSTTTKQPPGCWYLDGNFPGFVGTTSPSTCVHRNSMSIGVSLDLTQYSAEVLLVGVDGYLFLSGKSEEIIESACNNEFPPKCSSLIPIDEECSPDTTDLSLDTFFATNFLSNLITMERTEIQRSPRCDQDVVRWNPQVAASNFNPNFFTKNNITITDAASAVIMHVQFANSYIAKTTFNPQSGTSMFGSLSGWFGFLSDGWGIMSLLFMVEELLNYFRASR